MFGFVSVVVQTTLAASNVPSVRVDLPGMAKCIDGSPAVYYISQGTRPTKFYIYHQGGGWCQTAEECAQRATTVLGSSKQYPAVADLGSPDLGIVFADRNPVTNPLMHDWTYIYLPYCDGGSFSGDAEVTVAGELLQFRGLRIREAVIAAGSLDKATDLVVGGCSAGGAASYLHVDWYAAVVPSAKVRAVPDSGWFLDGPYARDGKPDYDSRMENMYTMINAVAGLDAACTGKGGHRCLFAPYAIAFIKTPVFALNSRFDASMGIGMYGPAGSEQFYNCTSYTAKPCDPASVNLFGHYIAAQMKAALVAPHGAFLDGCFRHCAINAPRYDTISIDSKTAAESVAAWYTTGLATFTEKKADFPCVDCCA